MFKNGPFHDTNFPNFGPISKKMVLVNIECKRWPYSEFEQNRVKKNFWEKFGKFGQILPKKFFCPILLKFRMHHYLRECMKNLKKFLLLLKNTRFQATNFWTGGRKNNATLKKIFWQYLKIPFPLSNFKKDDKKSFKKNFMKWGLLVLDFLTLIFWTPKPSAFTL